MTLILWLHYMYIFEYIKILCEIITKYIAPILQVYPR